jgi:hypothetical protein
MNISSLSALIPMEVQYPLDSNVNLTNNITNYFYGLNLYSVELFNYARDLSINYYNTFILTDKFDKADFLTLNTPVTANYPKKFSTTIQNLALTSFGLGFWEDFVSEYATTSNSLSCDGTIFSTGSIRNLGSWNMYEIELLNPSQCYISKRRNTNSLLSSVQEREYLSPSIDNDSNLLRFSTTPFIFNYLYNESNNTIIFYLNYAPLGNNSRSLFIVTQEVDRVILKSVDEYIISDLGLYNLSAVFCLSYRDADTRLREFTTSYNAYKKTFSPTADTSFNDSFTGLQNNYLVSTDVVFTNNQYLINFQPLKNQLDTKYNFTINNNFSGFPFDNRDYQSIVSGTNQELGFPDLTLTYYTYNAPITFKKGSLTYFHFPVSATPFSSLNVNDSKLVENGSFAGQNPLDSDKIFKKLQPTFTGEDIDNNQTGTYLCTWLYTSSFESRPIWLDRYYNPNFLSLVKGYTQNFNKDFLNIVTSLCAQNFTYFDKVSDLTFEPNATYSYYRLAEADITRINNRIYEKQINYDAIQVYDGNLNLQQIAAPTITLGNNSGSLSQKTSASGDFSICFNIKSKDFTNKIGNNILNNFINANGLNVTNYDNLNNLILFTSGSNIIVCNTQFENLQNYKVLLNSFNLSSPDTILSIDFNNNIDGYYVTSLESSLNNVAINASQGANSTNFYLSMLDRNFTTTNTVLLTSFSGGEYNFVSSNVDKDYYYALFNTFGTKVSLANQNYFLIKYPLSGILTSQSVSNVTNLNLPRWGNVNGNTITLSDFTLFNSTYNFAISAGEPVYYLTDYKNNSICVDINQRPWYVYKNVLYHSVNNLGDLKGFNLTYLKDSNNKQTITNVTTDNVGNIYLISDNGTKSFLYKLNNNREPVFFKELSSNFGTNTTKYLDVLYVNENGVIEGRPYVIYDPYQPSSLSAVSLKEVNIFNNKGDLIYVSPLNFLSDTLNTGSKNQRGLRRTLANVEQLNKSYKAGANPINFNYYVSDIAGDLSKQTVSFDLQELTNQDLFFTFTFDSITGTSKLYINSILVDETDTTNIKYAKSPVSGNIEINYLALLDRALASTQFKGQNLEMYDIKAFNTVLNSFDIRNIFIRASKLQDLVWNVPAGKRNITETIQQNFKFSLPGYKTNLFDIIVTGAKGLDEIQREAIAIKIREFIKGSIPINTIVNEVNIRSNE